MSAPAASRVTQKPDYGLDASGFQRVLLVAGVVCVVTGRLLIEHSQMAPSAAWVFVVGRSMLWTGLGVFLAGGVMYWSSNAGKLYLRDAILNSIPWRGDEHVLDVGCGPGLMLIGAAKRLKSGCVTGVDMWSQDQKNNNAEAALENARREGVAERVKIQNADGRELPFPDQSFDVVLSSFSIHNMGDASGREKAIREIARVLKPGGQLVMADIRHTRKYQKTLRSLGWQDTQRSFPNFIFFTPTRVLRATKP
jgi:arsenite methyltransferase